MKKIFLSLLLLFIAAAVFAQHPIGNDSLALQTLGNSNTLVKSKGAIGSDSGFVNASYSDTTAANRGKIKNYPGALIRTGNTIWLRNNTATMWIPIGTGTAGGDSTLFALSGTRTAHGDVTGDLDGHLLITQNGNIVHVLPNANEFRVLNNGIEWLQISPPQKNSLIRAINPDSGTTSQYLVAAYDDFPGFTATTIKSANDYVEVSGSLRHGFTHFAARDTVAQTDMFLYAKDDGPFAAAGFEILSQAGVPYIHIIGNTLAQTITFDANNIFPRNGTPAIGKVPTGTDALGSWTWQAGGGGSGDTTLTWEQTLNNQGAIPFAVAHNTDLNDNNFTLSNSNNFTVQSNSGNSPNSLLQTTPTNGQIYVAGDSTEAGVLVQNNNTTSTSIVQLRANKTTDNKSHIIVVNPDSIHISGTSELNLRVRGLPYTNDTLTRKPLAIGADGKVYTSNWIGDAPGAAVRDTAYLLQGYGTLINNLEGVYKPNGFDVLIAVDTSVIATKTDITIITNSDTAIFIVDSISNSPPAGAVDGNDYLVGTSPTGLFAGHANDIAELIGGVYSFTDPVAQQQLIVDNAVTYATYQFNGTIWVQTSVLWRVGGNRALGQNAFFGRIDKAAVPMRAWNKNVIRLDTTRDVKFYKFIGTRPGNYAMFDSVTGNIDTGFFRPLIAGTGISIDPGPVGDTISSTGGGSSLSAPSGYTLHGTGTGVYQDSIIYKDTTRGWVGINTAAPASLLDIHLIGFPGTISVTNGSATVTGTNTRFLDQFKSGDSIYIDNLSYFRVSSIASNTSLTLIGTYSGSTAGTASYTNAQTARGVLRIAANGRVFQYGAPFMHNGTTADGNSAYGYNSLRSLTSGTFNTAIGIDVLGLNATGAQNTGIGYKSLSKTTASFNSGFGSNVLLNNTSGESNAALGTYSLYSNTTGSWNTAVGNEALLFNSSGNFNTAVGYEALYNSTGGQNTAIGSYALATITSGTNTAIGYDAARYSTGATITAIGSGALRQSGAATNSVAIGGQAGQSATGNNNVFIGVNTGLADNFGVPTGSNNLMIGTGATLNWNESNAANIFNTIWIDANNGADSTASTTSKTGLNITTPNSTLQVNGSFAKKYNGTATGITLDATHDVVEVTATGQTITLPTSVGITGRVYTIKLTASGSGTVATTSSQTIDGSTTYSLSAQYKYVTVQSNGANWIIIANN